MEIANIFRKSGYAGTFLLASIVTTNRGGCSQETAYKPSGTPPQNTASDFNADANPDAAELQKLKKELIQIRDDMRVKNIAANGAMLFILILIYFLLKKHKSSVDDLHEKHLEEIANILSKNRQGILQEVETTVKKILDGFKKNELSFVEHMNQSMQEASRYNSLYSLACSLDENLRKNINIPVMAPPLICVEDEQDLAEFLKNKEVPNFDNADYVNATTAMDTGFLDIHSYSTLEEHGGIIFIPRNKTKEPATLFSCILREFIRIKNILQNQQSEDEEHLAVSQTRVYEEEIDILGNLSRAIKMISNKATFREVTEATGLDINSDGYESFQCFLANEGFTVENISRVIEAENAELGKWQKVQEALKSSEEI